MAADEQPVAAAEELDAKLALIRAQLDARDLGAVRLRGSDWFAWFTGGGSSVVDTSAEGGVAEVLVTHARAIVIADRIDACRLRAEEVPSSLPVIEVPWAAQEARDGIVREVVDGRLRIASDRPAMGELPLPAGLAAARRQLMPAEVERYRALGADAARALTASLCATTPDMSEAQVAAITCEQLVHRAMWPVVVLVAGARRLPLYRHPTPCAAERIGERAMVVVCARRHGLIANLTRFVYFRQPSPVERAAITAVADVEAQAFEASTLDANLGDVYRTIAAAYVRAGFAGAEADHHQGGLAGYLTREEIATPYSEARIGIGSALTWNPSLPGAKIEDTVVVGARALEVLTVDPQWPVTEVAGRARPDVLVLS